MLRSGINAVSCFIFFFFFLVALKHSNTYTILHTTVEIHDGLPWTKVHLQLHQILGEVPLRPPLREPRSVDLSAIVGNGATLDIIWHHDIFIWRIDTFSAGPYPRIVHVHRVPYGFVSPLISAKCTSSFRLNGTIAKDLPSKNHLVFSSPGTQKLKKIERFGSHRKHSKIDILRNFEEFSDSPALHVAGRRTLCVGSCDPHPGA